MSAFALIALVTTAWAFFFDKGVGLIITAMWVVMLVYYMMAAYGPV